jgi:subtilisin
MKYLLLISLLSFNVIPKEPKAINVMVIDTGIAQHDLLKNVQYNDSDDYVDHNGHGTHVAGLIQLGKDLNDPLCPQVRIHSCKYFEDSAKEEALAECVEKANHLKMDYINVSGGGPGYLKREHLAFKKFKGKVYAATGNNGQHLNKKVVYYPASYRYKNKMTNIIMVQSDCNGKTCAYSNVHSNAIKSYGDYVKSTSLNNSLKSLRGTSQATAIALHDALKKKCNELKGGIYGNR